MTLEEMQQITLNHWRAIAGADFQINILDGGTLANVYMGEDFIL